MHLEKYTGTQLYDTSLIFIVYTLGILSSGVPSDAEACDDDLCVDGERIEENEELKLHVMGSKIWWAKHLDIETRVA